MFPPQINLQAYSKTEDKVYKINLNEQAEIKYICDKDRHVKGRLDTP